MSLKLISSFDRHKLVTNLIFYRTFKTTSQLALSNNKNNKDNEASSSSSSSSDSSDDEKTLKPDIPARKNPNLNKYKMSFTTLKSPNSLKLAKPLGQSKINDKTDKDTLKQEAVKVAKLIDSKEKDKIADDLMKPLKKSITQSEKTKEIDKKNSFENVLINIKDIIDNNQKDVLTTEIPKSKQKEETKAPDTLNSIILDSLKEMTVVAKPVEEEKKDFIFTEVEEKQRTTEKRNFKKVDNSKHLMDKVNPLGIFTNADFKPLSNQPQESRIWQKYRKERLEEVSYMPPLNAFEEAVNLTEEGKLWHFPIDNEAQITNEDYNMPFYEHVLLDHYLDEFPQIEPVQKFMRLVITGLSKNAFMTVKEKQETIYWYKNYFNDKIEIINESLRLEQLENEELKGLKVN